jgi:hypothetical protein
MFTLGAGLALRRRPAAAACPAGDASGRPAPRDGGRHIAAERAPRDGVRRVAAEHTPRDGVRSVAAERAPREGDGRLLHAHGAQDR